MVMLRGKVVVMCPETGAEVTVHKQCANPKGDGTPCPYFKHWGILGNKVSVTCTSTKTKYLSKV